jgi:two-component system, LytTR family, response regulator
MSNAKTEKPIRTLIVDDEFRSRSSLRILLGHHFPWVEIVGEGETVAEGIVLAQNLRPELLFLDIMLPDGSAFDLLDVLGGMQLKVIIVSAFPEHSVRAFKYATVHYLLKPIDLRDLQEAVQRVMVQSSAEDGANAVPVAPLESIALPTLEGFKLVPIADIAYCEADSNYTVFHFANGNTFMVSNNLGYYEEMLADQAFFRVHHRFLVHLLHIKAYHRGRGGWVEMANGKSVEVSARKRDSFLAKLGGFTRGM